MTVAMKEQVIKIGNPAAEAGLHELQNSDDAFYREHILRFMEHVCGDKASLLRHLEVHPSRLLDYVVDRHGNGNMTVRPEAVFG